MLEVGTVLQKRYRVVNLLGKGGMGAVYRAWDLRLKLPVALKEMQPQPDLDLATLEALREQFEQEAAILARLNHPNLVRVSDYFEEASFAYLVMDFVEGQSLSDLIAQFGAQSEDRVLDWARQLLEALAYCHNQGVVHRDIKPQNIIVTPDGRVLLVDFGLVKLWDADDPRTKTAMRGLGTPEYAPPEQYNINTDHTGPTSDLYSLGATLYHSLTGQAPPTATERMAIPEKFSPLRQLAAGVSEQTELVVTKALSLVQAERWQTSMEMATALTVRVATLPSAVTEPTTPIFTSVARAPSRPIAQKVYRSADPARSASRPVVFPAPKNNPPAKPVSRERSWSLIATAGLFGTLILCLIFFAFFPGLWGGLRNMLLGGVRGSVVLEDFSLRLDNQSPYDVCYVYISSVGADGWESNLLDAAAVITPQTTRVFDLPAGEYDFLVENCDYAVLGSAWNFSANMDFVVGGNGLQPLRVTNTTGHVICDLFISPVAAEDWGYSFLGEREGIVDVGAHIFFVEPGIYDLRAKNCQGEILSEAFGIDLDEAADWVAGKSDG